MGLWQRTGAIGKRKGPGSRREAQQGRAAGGLGLVEPAPSLGWAGLPLGPQGGAAAGPGCRASRASRGRVASGAAGPGRSADRSPDRADGAGEGLAPKRAGVLRYTRPPR